MNFLKSLFGSVVAIEPKQVIDPDVLVKQIHDEVDALEEQSIKAVEKMLSELEIPTETKLVDKARLMQSLGFNESNETVAQSLKLQNQIIQAENLKQLNQEKLHLINRYRSSYPLDKIIPFTQFNKVLEKYNLIYAPSKNYIKDVPEKNLLEISKSKTTEYRDREIDVVRVNPKDISFYHYHKNDYKKTILKLLADPLTIYPEDFRATESDFKELINLNCPKYLTNEAKGTDYYYLHASAHRLSKSGLFIAAPKSHFNLDGLQSQDKGYFNYEKIELKDPIAFSFLKGDLVRIISKWGTSDDQSYLDPIVQNENLN